MQQLLEFATNHSLLVIAFLGVLSALMWSLLRDGLNSNSVTPQEAINLINHEEAVVVDVRETSEFTGGHIIDAIHIPAGSLSQQLKTLEKHKSKPIIMSCMSGARSGQACGVLLKNGFEKVHNLKGGVMAWQNASLPLVTGSQKKASKKQRAKAAAAAQNA